MSTLQLDKRKALLIALGAANGMTDEDLAWCLDITPATVARARREELSAAESSGLPPGQVNLSLVLDVYLCAIMKALNEQCKVAGNEEYLKGQPANLLSALHESFSGKALLLIRGRQRQAEIDAGRQGEV